jgi:hypothetical protein
MAWNRDRAIGRIQKLQQSVPNVRTVDLARELYPTFLSEVRAGTRATADIRPALHNISRNQAILVDGVHIKRDEPTNLLIAAYRPYPTDAGADPAR